jgi:hypothetical protein
MFGLLSCFIQDYLFTHPLEVLSVKNPPPPCWVNHRCGARSMPLVRSAGFRTLAKTDRRIYGWSGDRRAWRFHAGVGAPLWILLAPRADYSAALLQVRHPSSCSSWPHLCLALLYWGLGHQGIRHLCSSDEMPGGGAAPPFVASGCEGNDSWPFDPDERMRLEGRVPLHEWNLSHRF